MDDDQIGFAILIGIGIVILLLVLSLPVTGTIFGTEIELPLIGWIGFAAFAVIALLAFVTKR